MPKDDVILFDTKEVDVASSWHGGQSSMLYAISSTGYLGRGTIRPRGEGGKPMTDAEWMSYLAAKLEAEAEEAANFAKEYAIEAKGKEKREFQRDRRVLLAIAAKAKAAQQ